MAGDSYKYQILMDYLKNEIAGGEIAAGEKIPSENELSAKFGISRFTVRRAIELLANEGILEKRHGSGTYLKNAESGKSDSCVIGVITTYLDDYIFPGIIGGIDEILTSAGYSISLGITGNKSEKEAVCLSSMLSRKIDGLIIEGTKSALPCPNLALLHELKNRGIPIVFINGRYAGFDSSYVLMDDEKSGRIAADCLISSGHTQIGGIFKSDDIQGHLRYKGFAAACHANGIAVNEEAVLWYTTEDIASIFLSDYDRLLMKRFEHCTALVCYNDQIALKFADVMKRSGKNVPGDISLVGFDNSSLCEISDIKLTSVSHARDELGREAARAIISIIKTGRPVRKKIAPELICRNSVRRLT